MNTKLNTIKVGSRDLPIKCDNYVLAQIQEEFGSLDAFENKLLGYEILVDEDGRALRDDDGMRRRKRVEPSVKAVTRFLYLCVEEGLDIEGKEPVNEKDLIRTAGSPFTLIVPLYAEFKKAFEDKNEKKAQPSRSRK